MTIDQHKNFAISTVATAPSPAASGTSLGVNPGDGPLFPTPPFNAVVWPVGVQPLVGNAEIIRVTSLAGDSFSVIARTQENTNARAIQVGDQIMASATAKTFTDIEALVPSGARVLLDDWCASSALPSGASSSGSLTFDSTRLARVLGVTGPGPNLYTGPAVAFNGPLTLQVDIEFVNTHTTGSAYLRLTRADTGGIGNITFQSDGNITINDTGGSNRFASGAGKVITGQRFRASLSISDVIDAAASNLQTMAALLTEGLAPNGLPGYAVGSKYVIGGTNIPAGTLITPQLATDATRQIAMYRFRWYRGGV